MSPRTGMPTRPLPWISAKTALLGTLFLLALGWERETEVLAPEQSEAEKECGVTLPGDMDQDRANNTWLQPEQWGTGGWGAGLEQRTQISPLTPF